MILGEARQHLGGNSPATLDGLFRRAVARHPDMPALIDAPNRAAFTDGMRRELTYAQADHVVSAIAGRLHRLGLPTDAVVACQLPNTVESVLTLLGILRAGMIATLLPMLWRKQDIVTALSLVGAKAIIVSTRIGTATTCAPVMQAAAELFPVRYVCAFGEQPPDGVVPFDDLLDIETPDPLPQLERSGDSARHVAVVTFDVTASGLLAVARNHSELTAGGLAIFLEGSLGQDASLLSTVPLASFAGLCATFMPWLLSGGTLALHHPFDANILAAQFAERDCDAFILPASLIERLAASGHLPNDRSKTAVALWRMPERMAGAAPWQYGCPLVDVACFGEAGLIAKRRDSGMPSALGRGTITAPRDAPNAVPVAEVTRTPSGTLILGGAMVPGFVFPPGAERGGVPCLQIDRAGFVDTGYTCKPDGELLSITGAPAGIANVGGYRFRLSDIDALMDTIDGGATLATLPHPLTGQCLAGHAPDAAVRQQLAERGANPLIAVAFRARHAAAA